MKPKNPFNGNPKKGQKIPQRGKTQKVQSHSLNQKTLRDVGWNETKNKHSEKKQKKQSVYVQVTWKPQLGKGKHGKRKNKQQKQIETYTNCAEIKNKRITVGNIKKNVKKNLTKKIEERKKPRKRNIDHGKELVTGANPQAD